MTKPRATLIADILVEHYEELEFLWGQRQSALDAPAYSMRELVDLQERIEAHVQGLLIGGEQVIPLLVEGLSADDPSLAFAAGYPLLRLNQPDPARLVLDAFVRAHGGRLDGLRQALCHGPVSSTLRRVRTAARSAEPLVAPAALEVLAFQSPSDCEADLLVHFLRHDTPEMRRGGWRVAELLKSPVVLHQYKKAIEDDDPRVRSEAHWAAAWARQNWLLDCCRTLAKSPNPENLDALQLLAILGGPEDLSTIGDPCWSEQIGASWFKILGSFGHPAVIVDLIQGMENSNPRLAVAAGAAFTKITGCDVVSKTRVQLPPEDGHEPDEFEKEFLDEAFLPDPSKARDLWKKAKGMYSEGLRFYRGKALGHEITRDLLNRLDLPSLREACLRASFDALWSGGLIDLERLAQPPACLPVRAHPAGFDPGTHRSGSRSRGEVRHEVTAGG